MAAGYAPRALHRTHVGRWVWVLWGAPGVLSCETTLGALSPEIDAGHADAGSGDGGRGFDAGNPPSHDAGALGDAQASSVVGDAALPDAAVTRDAGVVGDGAVGELDAGDAAALFDGGRDAAVVNSQAWPLSDAGSGDAGGAASTEAGAVIVDGDISEWPRGIWTELPHLVEFAQAGGSSELRATCAWQVHAGNLFLAVVVRDDVHENSFGGFDIWQGDSVQVAFDVGEGRSPYDWEYGVALVNGEVEVHRWLSTDADLDHFPAAVSRWGDVTVYEMQFAPVRLGLTSLDAAAVRASVAVNESDDNQRTRALELTPGIVETEKSKAAFVKLSW